MTTLSNEAYAYRLAAKSKQDCKLCPCDAHCYGQCHNEKEQVLQLITWLKESKTDGRTQ